MFRLITKLFLPVIALVLGGLYLNDVLNKSASAAVLIKPVYILLCFFFVIILFTDIRAWLHEQAEMKKKGELQKTDEETQRELKTVLICVAATALYLIALKYIGFAVSTSIYLFLGFTFMKNQKKLLSALIAVLVTAALLFVFKSLLSVPLPKGFIGI